MFRRYKDIAKLDFENSEDKEIVSIERFGFKVMQELNGAPYKLLRRENPRF